MENWLLMQTFYHGLNTSIRETVDTTVGGAFLSLNLADPTLLCGEDGFQSELE
jgi:hypothetical protein